MEIIRTNNRVCTMYIVKLEFWPLCVQILDFAVAGLLHSPNPKLEMNGRISDASFNIDALKCNSFESLVTFVCNCFTLTENNCAKLSS